MKKKWVATSIVATLLVVLGGGYGIYHATTIATQQPPKKETGPATPNIDGVACQSMEGSKKHIHVHLDIYENGQKVIVPADTGIRPDANCLYWLHTHDDSGVVHVESPVDQTFTLGQFFDVWNRYDKSKTFQKVYVNGKPFTGDFRSIPLVAHDEIVLEDGPNFVTPESSYTFPQGE